MARLFGTDGVRGIANVELTPELAFKLGRAAASYFGRETRNPKIIIGRDTRLSGTMLEAALAAGICSAGCSAGGNAHLLGVIPTPAVSYLTSKLHANAGAVISASHNPFEDNGIKFFSQTGHKLPDAVEDEIEAMVAAEHDSSKTTALSSSRKPGTSCPTPWRMKLKPWLPQNTTAARTRAVLPLGVLLTKKPWISFISTISSAPRRPN